MENKVILKNRYCKVDATMAYDKVYEPLAWMPRKVIEKVFGGKKAIIESSLKWYGIRSKAESDAKGRGFVGNMPSDAADDIIQQFGELFYVDMGFKKLQNHEIEGFQEFDKKLYGIYPDAHIFFNLSDSIGMGYVKKAWSEGIRVEAMPINVERIVMDEYSITLVLDTSQPVMR